MTPGAGDLVYGRHPVEALLREAPERIARIWLAAEGADRRAQSIADRARGAGVALQPVARADLDRRLPGVRHQGVAAELRPGAAPPVDLAAVLDRVAGDPLVLVLDGVQDPHNLGACLRTAEAAGVDLVILPRHGAAGLSAAVRKVAAGAAERVPVLQAANLARALERLRERGLWLVGTSLEEAGDLYAASLRGPLALVMGGEHQGLRRLTRERCDLLLRLPMQGQAQSLNVSVATGVCLYEILRQRRAGGGLQ